MELDMDIHEDSIPLRFTPDGLDEASIDALIAQAYGQVSDVSAHLPADPAQPCRARSRTKRPSPNDQAA
jgi:hypothetical protein